MNNTIQHRLSALRNEMKKQGIDAFIIPGTDPHMSEYIADHWKCREWISGFDGSAGTVVVTANDAGLWTDSRYFLQAGIQLKDTGITLFKEGLPDTPSIETHLINTLPAGSTVAIDGNLFGIASAAMMRNRFESKELNFRTDFYPFNAIWEDRPAIPKDMIFVYPEEFCGESALSKRARILEALQPQGANALLLTALDDIAWALNLRGTDVECNPVAICYVFMSEKENILFIDKDKLTVEVKEYLQHNNILTASYDKIGDFLGQLPENYRLLLDPAKVNDFLLNAVSSECHKTQATSPVALLKAVKNETEIEGFRKAMAKDGVALVRFFRWLEENIPSGNVTEQTVAEKLIEFREQQENYVGESFSTIAGYKGHGAIVHYRATPESDATIHNDGFLLIDSGAQYFDGTTDITRTVILGEPTERQKRDFTLVLKGHINLGMTRFPQGTRGDQLDVLARRALWDLHLNYLHGTGHGIGHFLNVHEGPQSIRLNHNPTLLVPGMVTSNEPGLYITDQYGIRHENLILTVEDGESEFGKFYSFETLTLFPFDLKGIDASLLSAEEKAWLNAYHQKVYDKLSPALNAEEQAWLAEKTKAI
ncbi:MAG: aminopeptidase P family protein [Bacteroidales bacterium]